MTLKVPMTAPKVRNNWLAGKWFRANYSNSEHIFCESECLFTSSWVSGSWCSQGWWQQHWSITKKNIFHDQWMAVQNIEVAKCYQMFFTILFLSFYLIWLFLWSQKSLLKKQNKTVWGIWTSHFSLHLWQLKMETNQKSAEWPIINSRLRNSQLGLFVREDKGSDIAEWLRQLHKHAQMIPCLFAFQPFFFRSVGSWLQMWRQERAPHYYTNAVDISKAELPPQPPTTPQIFCFHQG